MENEIKELNKMHNKMQQRIKSMNEQIERIDQEAIKNNIEIWRKIKSHLDYSVSSHGRVRNDKTKLVLKQGIINTGYYFVSLFSDGIGKSLTTHRLVAEAFLNNTDNKRCVDHINSNRLNNDVNNLRWCTDQQNNFNQSLSKRNKSSVKGVYFDKSRNNWQAYISINGKKLHLGRYDTLEQAKKVRIQKAKEIYGEFVNSCET